MKWKMQTALLQANVILAAVFFALFESCDNQTTYKELHHPDLLDTVSVAKSCSEPDDPHTLSAYKQGVLHFDKAEYDKALKLFGNLVDDLPVSATYMIARCYKQMLDPEFNWNGTKVVDYSQLTSNQRELHSRAKEAYWNVYVRCPDHDFADDALGMVAGLEYRVGHFKGAADLYMRCIREYFTAESPFRYTIYEDARLAIKSAWLQSDGLLPNKNSYEQVMHADLKGIPKDTAVARLLTDYIVATEDIWLMKQLDLVHQYIDSIETTNEEKWNLLSHAIRNDDDYLAEKLRQDFSSFYHPVVDYERALQQLKKGSLQQAERKFKEWIRQYGFINHPVSPLPYYFYAETLYRLRDFEGFLTAADEYLSFFERGSLGKIDDVAPTNYFWMKMPSHESSNICPGFPINQEYFKRKRSDLLPMRFGDIVGLKKKIFVALEKVDNIEIVPTSVHMDLIITEYAVANAVRLINPSLFIEKYLTYLDKMRQYKVRSEAQSFYLDRMKPYFELMHLLSTLDRIYPYHDQLGPLNPVRYETDLRKALIAYEKYYIASPDTKYDSTTLTSYRENLIEQLGSSNLLQPEGTEDYRILFLRLFRSYSDEILRLEGSFSGSLLQALVEFDFDDQVEGAVYAQLYINPKTLRSYVLRTAFFYVASTHAASSSHTFLMKALVLHYFFRDIDRQLVDVRVKRLLSQEEEELPPPIVSTICEKLREFMSKQERRE